MRGKWILSAASVALLTAIGMAAPAQAQNASDPPGDSTSRVRIAPGQTVTSALQPAGDKDWYRLSVRTGQLYKVSLNGVEGGETLDPMLRVVTASGEEIASNDDHNGLNSYVEFTPARSGDVFIEARGYADDAAGPYTLNVVAQALPADPAGGATNTRARLMFGTPVSAGLDYAGDKDWYRVELSQGQSYRFSLTGNAGDGGLGDPLLHVFSADGAELASDDDGGDGLNSYLEFTAPSTGVYFVEARGFNDDASGGYVLTGAVGDIPANTSTDASLSADGDARDGTLSPAGDSDWYRVNLTEGQSMRVGLNGGAGDGALGDPLLVLHGPDGAEIARDDDGGEGLNSWLEFIAPAAGAYYLEARGFGDGATGRYSIQLTAGEIPGVADGAEPLTAGGEGRSSVIAPAGDKDWFQIQLVEGRPYRFHVEGAEPDAISDPTLTIFDSEGHQIASDDDGGKGAAAYLNFVSPTGGTYYAQVTGFNETVTGHYLLQVNDTDIPGNTNTDEELDAESGDDRASAIEIPGDLDYFRVQLTGGQRYDVNVGGNGDHPLTDPFLTVHNEEGVSITTDDDSGPGLDARLSFVPQSTGTFYVAASGNGGSTGGYKISIGRHGS